VTSRCDAAILLGPDHFLPATAVFDYSTDDPYTVRMTMRIDGARPSEWVFDRSLLIEGIEVPTGIGLVQVWPEAQPSNPPDAAPVDDLVIIRLGTPESHATLAFSAVLVRDFVARIQQAVAMGTESDLLNLDSALADLLSGAGNPESGAA